ncbi:2-oxoisovalerate dehydrogenase e2 component dihydrolipoyl transacylase [Trichoderma arundinaceum]|uniref:Dihydrolipoamide acetyltransferase component of pyruvate dehydrogenase complex n=1 Tax=Trichoderma arundinaceum TaxID=490622 RepID=A0A395NHE6_TRIAR|nr:2-oxoisovalerate dehydrogenase e2 component dihydrolipoyl transacylase [Trichoderma arundinaceum]
MFLQRGSRVLRRQWGASKAMGKMALGNKAPAAPRWFSESRRLYAVKPVLLADIGEGIVECEVIQWFVEPGAHVEEFSPLCEVQSDKASVEITSRFSGVVKKLYYETGEMAKVGKPFVDIDIEGGAEPEDAGAPKAAEASKDGASSSTAAPESRPAEVDAAAQGQGGQATKPKGKAAALATPAVRHLSKELNIDILDIDGTGKDGRVLKEDIYKFVQQRDASASASAASQSASTLQQQAASQSPFVWAPPPSGQPSVQTETRVQLTNTQQQMFKTMTRSLNIPHFLYSDEVDFSDLVSLRTRLNKVLSQAPAAPGQVAKLSYLPFIIKAVSMALYQFPILNSRVEIDPATSKPSLIMRSQHNIGVAMDTPQGLLVPVIKDVGSLNILSIAAELSRLQSLAVQGKLTPNDFSGGTITVSNIGNIGGTYLSPVIVEREVAILGVGRMRTVPAFDENDNVVKKHITNFSWSADHRVVDGATLARAAELIRSVVEEPDVMVMHLR